MGAGVDGDQITISLNNAGWRRAAAYCEVPTTAGSKPSLGIKVSTSRAMAHLCRSVDIREKLYEHPHELRNLIKQADPHQELGESRGMTALIA